MNLLKPISSAPPSTGALQLINSINRFSYILRLLAFLIQLRFLRQRRSINAFAIDSVILCLSNELMSFLLYGVQYKILKTPNEANKLRYPLLFKGNNTFPRISSFTLLINLVIVVTLLLTAKQYHRLIKTENIFQGVSKTMCIYITTLISTAFIVKIISTHENNLKYKFNNCDYYELVDLMKNYLLDPVVLFPQVSLSFMSQSCTGVSELFIYLISASNLISIFSSWLFFKDEKLYMGWYLIDINTSSLFSSIVQLLCCFLIILQMVFAYKNHKANVPLKIDAIEEKKLRNE